MTVTQSVGTLRANFGKLFLSKSLAPSRAFRTHFTVIINKADGFAKPVRRRSLSRPRRRACSIVTVTVYLILL